MNSGMTGQQKLARALREGAEEERRAMHAADAAERHEALIVNAPAGIHLLHATMSKLHRQLESRHRTAAQMYRSYALRLQQQAELEAAGDAPSFMAAVINVAGVHAASVSLLGNASADIVLASDSTARAAQDLELALGEGPAHDCRSEGPLLVAAPDIQGRWISYGTGVEALGIQSIAAVPLRIGPTAMGSLVVFGSASRGIDASLERLCHIADAFVHILLADHRHSTHQKVPAFVAAELDHRPVLHQAAGMVSVQQGCSVDDALALLRTHAFAEDADLTTAAQQVVDKQPLIVER